MEASALGLLLGSWLQAAQAQLWPPALYACAALGGVLLLAGTVCWRLRAPPRRLGPRVLLVLLGAAACAFGATGWRAGARVADRLAPELGGRVLWLDGVVVGLPQRTPGSTRFEFAPRDPPAGVPSRLRVSWWRARACAAAKACPPRLRPGEVWRLPLRLRPLHGSANPGGFDAELAAFERGIGADASVVAGCGPPLRRGVARLTPWLQVQVWREALRERVGRALAGRPQAGAIAALALGDQAALGNAAWAVYRDTGVAHLMSVSGLHISLLAWAAGVPAGALWRRGARLPLLLPTPALVALVRLAAALGYAALAGFGVPAQRAALMLAVALLARLAARRLGWWQVMAWALAAVLLWDPWALLQAGFWLSFGAVALLFLSEPGRAATDPAARAGRWRAASRAQLAVNVGLVPLTLLFFQQVALLAPLANAFAIPLVTLVVVPLALAGLALPAPLDAWVWQLGAWLQGGLMAALSWLAAVPHAQWRAALPGWPALLAAALGVPICVLPWPWRLRLAGFALLLPVLSNPGARPAPGALEIWIADVGQGSALLVRTARHSLLFDTGPGYDVTGGDAGARIVVPLLRALGESRLDLVVLSHGDRDHSGGAAAVAAAFPGTPALGSLPLPTLRGFGFATPRRCLAGQRWRWDGVDFEVLHPPDAARGGNAGSCVLRVASARGSALLSGDIGRRQEAALSGSPRLRSDLLLAPHHGSNTSSSEAFLRAVAPAVVAVQAGFMNRYGHPHPAALQRWAAAGAAWRRTDRDGALLWRDAAPRQLQSWRAAHPRYWETAWSAPATVLRRARDCGGGAELE
jgi:competence protein ComEC